MVKSLGAIVNTVLEMTKKIRTEPNSDHSPVSVDKVAGNEDLIREILFRSPVRSLFNFTLVSKQWLSLIKNPQFPSTTPSKQTLASTSPQAFTSTILSLAVIISKSFRSKMSQINFLGLGFCLYPSLIRLARLMEWKL